MMSDDVRADREERNEDLRRYDAAERAANLKDCGKDGCGYCDLRKRIGRGGRKA